jgi:hypothetical protein
MISVRLLAARLLAARLLAASCKLQDRLAAWLFLPRFPLEPAHPNILIKPAKCQNLNGVIECSTAGCKDVGCKAADYKTAGCRLQARLAARLLL